MAIVVTVNVRDLLVIAWYVKLGIFGQIVLQFCCQVKHFLGSIYLKSIYLQEFESYAWCKKSQSHATAKDIPSTLALKQLKALQATIFTYKFS